MTSEIRPSDQKKHTEEHNENVDDLVGTKREEHAFALLPESLRGLSEEERALLEKKMVRKMDLVVL